MSKTKKKTKSLKSDVDTVIQGILDRVQQTHGKESCTRLTGGADDWSGRTVSTGSLGLDKALGVGGLPLGRVVEVYGPESSGKTTVTLHVLANAQRMGFPCAFIDAEHALDPGYAEKLGVDLDRILLSQPNCGEDALDTTLTMIAAGVKVAVVDSVALHDAVLGLAMAWKHLWGRFR